MGAEFLIAAAIIGSTASTIVTRPKIKVPEPPDPKLATDEARKAQATANRSRQDQFRRSRTSTRRGQFSVPGTFSPANLLS